VSEQPGRYQRSFSGLLASLLVTVLVIGAFVAFRAVFREEVENRPEPVDYVAAVGQAQDAGLTIVHPSSLPEDWTATSIDFAPGADPAWGMGMLTADGQFVGLRQERADLDQLLATYVEEDPNELQRLGEVSLDSPLAPVWSAFTDSGGDRAYAAEVDDQVVLAYGSASQEELETLVELLTTDPVDQRPPA
jgi:hypothetical protein